MAFLNSYFYRRILLTRGELPICGIHNQSNIFFLLSGMATTFKNSIMVQSSRLLYEILNGATIFEKQILFLAASSFGIPDPLFGLYYVYIYRQFFFFLFEKLPNQGFMDCSNHGWIRLRPME